MSHTFIQPFFAYPGSRVAINHADMFYKSATAVSEPPGCHHGQWGKFFQQMLANPSPLNTRCLHVL